MLSFSKQWRLHVWDFEIARSILFNVNIYLATSMLQRTLTRTCDRFSLLAFWKTIFRTWILFPKILVIELEPWVMPRISNGSSIDNRNVSNEFMTFEYDDSCNHDSSICLGFRSMFAKRIQPTKMVLDVLNVRQEHFLRRTCGWH